MWKIRSLAIILGLMFFVILRLLIFRYVPFVDSGQTFPYIDDILGTNFVVPLWLIMFSDISNLILFWLIGRKVLGEKYGFLAPIFYAISPWPAYLTISGSIFVPVLMGMLLFYFGLTLAKDKRSLLGISLSTLGLVIAVYLNFSMLFVLPFLILGIYGSRFFAKKNIKILLTVLIFLFLPIIIFSIFRRNSLKQALTKNVSLFNEVGLINSVNTFRGEARRAGYSQLGILVENKITYFGRHVLFNTLTAFSPYTYFTQQFRLLSFSFTPPIFVGLLVPFLYGLVCMFKGKNKIYYLLFLTIPLLIPAVLREYFPDLNSLILILPAIIFVSAWGMGVLVRNKKMFFITITVFLIFLQGLTTLYDITTREPVRYQETIQANK